MNLSKLAAAFAAVAALGAGAFVAGPARADNIVSNQWYMAGFGTVVPSAVFGPGYTNYPNGPVLPGGFAGSISAPTGTTWTITAGAGGGTFTVTDVETSGDAFQIFDNGNPIGLATSPFTASGQNPGQAGVAGGYTSTPNAFASSGVYDINVALGNANYSSGTFALLPGVNNLTITYLGQVGQGDVAFIAELARAAPGPMPGAGVLGLGFLALTGFAVRGRGLLAK
jgi:hypothetical protein